MNTDPIIDPIIRLFELNDSIRKLGFHFFLALCCLVCFVGCEKRIDLSLQEPYRQAVGKSFVLQRDYYIFQFSDSPNLFIGRISELPEEVSSSYIGNKFSGMTIVGIAKKGEIFQIKKIVEKETIETSDKNYYSLLLPENILVDVSFLAIGAFFFHNPPFTKTWSDPPIFDPKAALPLPADGIWWK